MPLPFCPPLGATLDGRRPDVPTDPQETVGRSSTMNDIANDETDYTPRETK